MTTGSGMQPAISGSTAGMRAHVPRSAPARCAGAQLPLKARALYITSLELGAGHRGPQEAPHWFDEALRRCQKPEYVTYYVHSKALRLTQDQKDAIRFLKRIRNQIEHYVPMLWSIELHSIVVSVLDALDVIRFLALECGNVRLTTDQHQRAEACLTKGKRLLRETQLYKDHSPPQSAPRARQLAPLPPADHRGPTATRARLLPRRQPHPTLSRSEATARRRAPGASTLTSVATLRAQCRRPFRRGAVGPARRAIATRHQPTSRRALPLQTLDELRSSVPAWLRLLHRPVERRRSVTCTKPAAFSRRAGAGPSRKPPRCRASVHPGSRSHDMAATSAVAGAHGGRGARRRPCLLMRAHAVTIASAPLRQDACLRTHRAPYRLAI